MLLNGTSGSLKEPDVCGHTRPVRCNVASVLTAPLARRRPRMSSVIFVLQLFRRRCICEFERKRSDKVDCDVVFIQAGSCAAKTFAFSCPARVLGKVR